MSKGPRRNALMETSGARSPVGLAGSTLPLMPAPTDKIRARFERLLSRGQAMMQGIKTLTTGIAAGHQYVDEQAYASWRAQAESALIDTFGERHAYTRSFNELGRKTSHYVASSQVGVLCGVIEAITHDELDSLTSLVVANIFADLMEMADHLHQTNYHVPAASLSGAVLEDALRRLCAARSVSFASKDGIDALNKKLASAGVYDNFTASSIDAWRHLRNDADHGHFQRVLPANVATMLEGVRRLLTQHARELGGNP